MKKKLCALLLAAACLLCTAGCGGSSARQAVLAESCSLADRLEDCMNDSYLNVLGLPANVRDMALSWKPVGEIEEAWLYPSQNLAISPSIVLGRYYGVEALATYSSVSVSDAVRIDGLTDETTLLLKFGRKNSTLAIVTFSPIRDGLVSVSCSPLPADYDQVSGFSELPKIEHIDGAAFRQAAAAVKDDQFRPAPAAARADSADWYRKVAVESLQGVKSVTKNALTKYTSEEEIVQLATSFVRSLSSEPVSQRVIFISERQLKHFLEEESGLSISPELSPAEIAVGLANSLVGSYGTNVVAANSILAAAVPPGSVYATALPSGLNGVCYVFQEWPEEYATLTVISDNGHGITVPFHAFLPEGGAIEKLVDGLRDNGGEELY